jgi:hypothetical protein
MTDLVEQILKEPEFKPNGFVWKHIQNRASDPLRSVQSAVDRMRELHDIEDDQFGPLCEQLLKVITSLVDKS